MGGLRVITTVYNGEPYADRAIPDILAQSFDDFEFILIDEGSQDCSSRYFARSPAAMARYGSSRLGAVRDEVARLSRLWGRDLRHWT